MSVVMKVTVFDKPIKGESGSSDDSGPEPPISGVAQDPLLSLVLQEILLGFSFGMPAMGAGNRPQKLGVSSVGKGGR